MAPSTTTPAEAAADAAVASISAKVAVYEAAAKRQKGGLTPLQKARLAIDLATQAKDLQAQSAAHAAAYHAAPPAFGAYFTFAEALAKFDALEHAALVAAHEPAGTGQAGSPVGALPRDTQIALANTVPGLLAALGGPDFFGPATPGASL